MNIGMEYADVCEKQLDIIRRMLDRLDASTEPQDMNLPGYRLHQLKGDLHDMWSVTVSGNWRVTFYFEEQDAYLVDYMDYH